jgi:hypothetical protein
VLRGHRVRVAELNRGRKHRLEFCLLNILWQIDDHRAGTSAASELERFFEHAWQIVNVHHEIRMLHDREGHPVEIRFLERHFTDVFREHLPGDRHEWNRIHEGVSDGGNKIGGTGAAGCHAHADFAGGAGVAFGRERAALFVSRQDRANFIGASERLVKLLRCSTWVGKNHVHALANEAFDDCVGSLHFAADFVFGKRCGRGRGFHGQSV